MPQGKALDLMQARPIFGFNAEVVGSNGYEATKGSQVVIFIPPASRASRASSRRRSHPYQQGDRGRVNPEVAARSPDAFLIIVSNPLDAMCYVARKVSGFPSRRVMGMAGILDNARYRCFIAMELKTAVEEVPGHGAGGHGDDMVPVVERQRLRGAAHQSAARSGSPPWWPAPRRGRRDRRPC